MFEIPRLETDRLVLRAPCEVDVEAYRAFFADGEASEFYGGPLSTKEAWNSLASVLGHWYLRRYG
ncbi:GNAT family N-acetyltransferase [Litoreibacter roseus]|uniref:Acetyltransferase (GNAT) family protein n=1 Tax=Litoreibacter roseus TaxID=2601869 RepID=A0A6N6JA46_9RHOB|nr:GNAT family N-acetyltransferase [Litoreibacter roseus]GFE63103.1 hypothetical protein KIN_01770 [Litoreibacter roseus]